MINKSLFYFIAILIFFSLTTQSCSKNFLTTKKNIDWRIYGDNITETEVSIGEWITYIVATTYKGEKKKISFSEQKELIKSKLPNEKTAYYQDYIFNAFFKNGKKKYLKIEDHIINHTYELEINADSKDSIDYLGLLSIPITGITYEQALDYVAYKTKAVNAKFKDLNKLRVECYLPAPSQFDSILTRLDSINLRDCPLINFKNSFCESCPRNKNHDKYVKMGLQEGYSPVSSYSYFPNEIGFYNLKGNVAEMTNIKGIAKGGSYNHYAKETNPGKVQTYIKPEPWLGFRVWYTVIGSESQESLEIKFRARKF